MSDGLWAEAGDTIFTRSNSLLGRLIRWGEQEKGEEPSVTNHSLVCTKSGWIRRPENPLLNVGPDAEIVEALWKTRRGPLKLNGTDVFVFRPIPPYNEQELEHFRHEAATYVGKTYGWWKLGGFLVKKMSKGKVDPTKWYFIKDRPICSFLAGWVNQKAQSVQRILARQQKHAALVDTVELKHEALRLAQFPFGMPPQACDPDEQMDYCQRHTEEWMEVK
jgi:hypothetical protein